MISLFDGILSLVYELRIIGAKGFINSPEQIKQIGLSAGDSFYRDRIWSIGFENFLIDIYANSGHTMLNVASLQYILY